MSEYSSFRGATESRPPAEPQAGAVEASVPRASPASVVDGTLHRLDPHFVTVQRIGGWITAGILSLVSLASGVALWVRLVPPTWGLALIGGGCVLITAALAWFAHFWPSIDYRHQSYRVSTDGIEMRRGVVWRQVINVPRSRVQHTDVNQGPIERAFGVAHLVIHTAGTMNASVRLEGLAYDRAAAIRDHLVAGGTGDAV